MKKQWAPVRGYPSEKNCAWEAQFSFDGHVKRCAEKEAFVPPALGCSPYERNRVSLGIMCNTTSGQRSAQCCPARDEAAWPNRVVTGEWRGLIVNCWSGTGMPSITSSFRGVMLLALAYALLGEAGLMLAIPPGYASPVFPSSGLALACVLWFGVRVLPGVWLGSLLLNLANGSLNGTLSQTSVLAAIVIACGATLQAFVGCWLVRSRLGDSWRDMEREQDVFLFLILGGVLAGLLSASIGVTGLYALGAI